MGETRDGSQAWAITRDEDGTWRATHPDGRVVTGSDYVTVTEAARKAGGSRG